ncbi:MAG: phage portal protein [Novosphingobium sp. 17-62-19]|uniref:phage portal protein n=1 Tax=Novosphingobium sp. 17-62-19 TaxID=1970406 RepID=UPI000BC50A4D|nr:phage portal protein [Novosphingobium sp. 17-62-19]OZA21375.1 MAG: phage portal protein [Novosphingobium sp. 17-62-19]HQS95080.1 phage portal protein [Novosphingobium sp.]
MNFIDRLLGRVDRVASAEPEREESRTVARSGPVNALTAMDFDSPVLAEFLRDGRISAAGLPVNETMALRNSTFFRAANLIASSMGMLPTHLMRRTIAADGKQTIGKAKDHPLYRVLLKRPNSYQTAFEFKSYMQLLALLDGNAYGLIIRGIVRGKPNQIAQIVPLKRKSVTPKLSDDWQLTFEYRRPSGGTVILPAADVFHFRHPISKDGLRGVDLVDMAVNAIGIAAQAEKAAGKVLKGGVMAGGALESEKELGEEAIKNLRQSMRERQADGEAAGEWLILEEGLKAKPFTTAKDAQYDEMRRRQAEEVSRFTGVPRPLLMFDETSWGSGIEQLGLYFVTYCLMPWFISWEQAIERSCLSAAEQDADELYVKFNEGALLRGSLKDQADFFAKALGPNSAYRTPDEVRSAFDLNAIEGGDKLPQPSKAAAKTKETVDE